MVPLDLERFKQRAVSFTGLSSHGWETEQARNKARSHVEQEQLRDAEGLWTEGVDGRMAMSGGRVTG